MRLLAALLLAAWLAPAAAQREWSPTEMVGTHVFDGVDGFAVFSATHLLWIYYDPGRPALNGPEPTDAELASLMRSGEAVGGTYRVTGPGRMSLDITHALDPRMVGQRWEYEYEWTEPGHARYWVLNPDGTRSDRTGSARKID
jgi:Lipocalin-like domain